jgi:hypothetical protein
MKIMQQLQTYWGLLKGLVIIHYNSAFAPRKTVGNSWKFYQNTQGEIDRWTERGTLQSEDAGTARELPTVLKLLRNE